MASREYFEEFEVDLPSALIEQLVSLFYEMASGLLSPSAVEEKVPEAQGVYQIYHRDNLVYVGKTDSEAGLKKRLLRHTKMIRGRRNLDPNDVGFKAVRVYVFTAMDLEQLLIQKYKSLGETLDWNNSGFGANDPGRERDTTAWSDSHFSYKFPIDLSAEVDLSGLGATPSAYEVLCHLKQELPYTVRFANSGGRSRKPHAELQRAMVTLPSGANAKTIREVLKAVAKALGDKWQITPLPGYIIIYRERKVYEYRLEEI
ncbi:GIY-YIG nuclease family protein [Algiphilus sp.]|uniref:GIY-YIG nuclease family protein n=1 Tax=Algiphilus sp. TaxID=1872431 RepID=UPI0032EE9386